MPERPDSPVVKSLHPASSFSVYVPLDPLVPALHKKFRSQALRVWPSGNSVSISFPCY